MTESKISDASMLSIKLAFLVSWVEMITEMRIGRELNKKGKFFNFNCAGNSFDIYYFDWDDSPAIPMSFDEFVGMNMALFATKNNYHLV